MSIIESLILGMIQGLTEFLPVSSSGHLVFFQNLFGLQEPGVTLEVLLHFGTLLSVFWVFKKDFVKLFSFYVDKKQRRFLFLLLAGVIPTGTVGVILGSYFEALFESTFMVGIMLLITGVLLYSIPLLTPGTRKLEDMNLVDAIWIGIFQGISVIPGISRSGATVTVALWSKLDKETAIKYSFMLAAPAIMGATLLELKDLFSTGVEKAMLWNYLAGAATAFGFGVLAIKVFITLLKEKKFHYFAFYCWAFGLLVLWLSF